MARGESLSGKEGRVDFAGVHYPDLRENDRQKAGHMFV